MSKQNVADLVIAALYRPACAAYTASPATASMR